MPTEAVGTHRCRSLSIVFRHFCKPGGFLMQENTSRPLSSTNQHLSDTGRCGLYLTTGQWAFLETCKNLHFENCSHWRIAQSLFLCCSHEFSYSPLFFGMVWQGGLHIFTNEHHPVLGNSFFFPVRPRRLHMFPNKCRGALDGSLIFGTVRRRSLSI